MALFTLVLEFDGGTYISQFRAASVVRAVAQYPSTENPVAIDGVQNVWCCSASAGKKFALLNIVATA
jgi:hypothetical protein